MKKEKVKERFTPLKSEEDRRTRTATWVVMSAKAAIKADSAFGFLSSVLYLNDYMTTYSVEQGKTKTKASRYEGVRYWSRAAIRVKEEKEAGISNHEKLIHEHSIPQSVIEERMYDILLSDLPKSEQIKQVSALLGLCCAAVITKTEDDKSNKAGPRSSFPSDRPANLPLCAEDQLLRYKAAGIDILDTQQLAEFQIS